MPNKFRDLIKTLPPERQKRIRARTEELSARMPARDLRQASSLSQKDLTESRDPEPGADSA